MSPPEADPNCTHRAADRCSCAVALSSRRGQVYNEEALRYFLSVEAQRAARSGRPLFVLLVERAAGGPIEPAEAARLFEGLWASLRDTDFFGWLREGRAVAAVLTEFSDDLGSEASRFLRERIDRALRTRLPSGPASRLDVRVEHYPDPLAATFARSSR